MNKLRTLILLVLFPSISFSASFDCTNTSSKVEKLICSDEKLSYLDSLLGQTYKSRIITSNEDDLMALKHAQRKWLSSRNLCKKAKCVLVSYKSRISELKNSSKWCKDYQEDFTYGRVRNIGSENSGKISDLLNLIGRKLLSDEIVKLISDQGNRSYLYRTPLNSDGVDDFVISTAGGSANCTSYYFLASSSEGYRLAPGVNVDRYSNEGKLCKSWGQSMEFMMEYVYGVPTTFAVIRDVEKNGETLTLALIPVSQSSKTAEMCKTKVSLSHVN